MLRALARFLGTGIPVIGVNYGRVGFLTAIHADELEAGIARVFAGEYRTIELPTLEVERRRRRRKVAVNDVVVAGGTLGRMVELGYSIGGEDLGAPAVRRPDLRDADRLDGLQPLERRPGARLGPRRDGADVRRAARARTSARSSSRAAPTWRSRNRDAPIVDATVLVDGQPGRQPRDAASRRSCGSASQRSLLATLPEVTFFRRVRRAPFGVDDRFSAPRSRLTGRRPLTGSAGRSRRCPPYDGGVLRPCASRTSS